MLIDVTTKIEIDLETAATKAAAEIMRVLGDDEREHLLIAEEIIARHVYDAVERRSETVE